MLCGNCGQWIDIVVTERGIKLAVTFTLDELADLTFLTTDLKVRARCLMAIGLVDRKLADKVRKEIQEAF